MANICDFYMRVTGRKNDVDEFIEIINRDYGDDNFVYTYKNNLRTYKMPANTHMFRIFEVHVDSKKIEDAIWDVKTCELCGYCVWSIKDCMIDNGYYIHNKNRLGASHLGLITKALNIVVEVYSEELGCEFQEHYLFDCGNLLINDCVDYKVILEDEHDNRFDDPITEGGFEEWLFGSFVDKYTKPENIKSIII